MYSKVNLIVYFTAAVMQEYLRGQPACETQVLTSINLSINSF